MVTVPVEQNRVGIAQVTDAKLQPGQGAGAGLQAIGAGAQAVGQGMDQLAVANFQEAKRRQAEQRNEDLAAAGKATADLRLEATRSVIDLRNQAAPGGEGHADAAGKWFDEHSQGVLDSIADPKVKRQIAEQLASMHASFVGGEMEWADAKRREKIGSDDNDAVAASAARIETAPDLASAQAVRIEERDASLRRIDSYDLPDDAKAKMRKGVEKNLAKSTLDLGIRTDWKATRELLDKGAFNVLPPEQIDSGYQAVAIEERRAAAVAANQTAIATKAAREAIATVSARQSTGEVVPDAELQNAATMAAAIGDTSTAVTLKAMQRTNGINRETQGWSPEQYDSEIGRLRALGEKRSPEEDIRLDRIQNIAGQRKAEFKENPGQWAALNGHPPPALDYSQPATWEARKAWQQTISAAIGKPVPFLQPAETSRLQAMYADGAGGRLKVINGLAAIGGRTAQQAMRQVAPSDAFAARIVLLPSGDRAQALHGIDARKANTALVDGGASAGDTKATTHDAFIARLGSAGSLLDQGEVAASLEIARNIYADQATKNGINSFNEDLWNTSIHRALGGTRDQNGQWLGGVGSWNGTPVLLPSRLTQHDFETHLSRITWSDKWAGAPVFADGTTVMTPAQVRQFTPIVRADGTYEFHGPNNTILQRKDHSVFTLDIEHRGK
ncbi:MAG: hypothetical protein JWN66_4976 [Sphingomonas bacterium]|uniref:hypothetical protein n=1 Tax=Sphingomonas bacterium TaxID=1895847 RepID=UPI0026072C48|nr:hypothetical protein [Sphingomonas bacterium]MDB5707860.1 hypothetical protein [Sphingomonas bacterium]